MKRVFLFLCAAVAVPAAVNAQMADAEIARAVAAAPARAQADATVISFGDDGSVVVLRQGSNGILCWDESSDGGFSSTCTSEENPRARSRTTRAIIPGGLPTRSRPCSTLPSRTAPAKCRGSVRSMNI